MQGDYDKARDRIAPLKRGEVTDANIFADVAGMIDKLRRQYCRLAACFLVFKNQTQKNALSDARQFGVAITLDLARANPLRYIAIYLVAIMVAIYLGVSLSAMSWDLLHGNPSAAFNQDADLVTRWIYFALAGYGMPILAVLLLRYLGWTVDAGQPNSYLISYATVFLVAMGVSAACYALAIELRASSGTVTMSFADLVFTWIKWSISPAIVAVYVAYHMDRQIDPMMPNIEACEHLQLLQKLMSCVFFGLLVTAFSALPALGISAVHGSAWPLDKLRLVVIGTTFIIGLIMALVSEFGLIKPKPASDR